MWIQGVILISISMVVAFMYTVENLITAVLL